MRPHPLALALPLVFVFCGVDKPAATAPPETHPFRVNDLVMLDRASDPAASPDGRFIAFARRKTDLEADKGRTDLWVMRADGSSLRQLTSHAANDASPQWISNTTVAFVSNRDGRSSQVWAIDVDGGEARPLTSLPIDVEDFRPSPDGKALAIAVEVYVDCPDLACTVQRDREKAAKKATGVIFDALPVRHWDEWRNVGKRHHVIVVPTAGGAPPVDLLKGIDADCPTRPFGDKDDFVFSPDGKEVALVFKAPMGSQEMWSTNEDVWLAPSDGSAPAKNVSTSNPARDQHPVYAPDGKSIAWLAMKKPVSESDRLRVVVFDRASGATRVLTEDWDRSADGVAWSKSGDRLFATADDLGHHGLFAIDARSGHVQTLVDRGHVGAFVETSQQLVVLEDSLGGPADFFSVATAGGIEQKRLTSLNEDAMKHVRLGAAEPFTFAGAKGETVHGYVMKPADFDQTKKFPLAFLVHGGPQGSFGDGWSYRWNANTYAAAGYAVVMIDFHGSTGYGQAFTDSISGDWGGAPFEDLMKGLDAALVKYPWIDGDRACALGASYGAWMMNYLAGKTDRFKCIVTHDGIMDNRVMYFETEELWFPEHESGGPPWEKPEGYSRFNPIDGVRDWKTPTLVVHGGKDYRIPDSQGLAVFTALQRKGVPSRLLYFPDENHWVLRPNDSILWHETVLGWLDKYIGPGAQAATK